MIKSRRIIVFLIFWLFVLSNNGQAQQSFYSKTLNDLYNSLPESCKIENRTIDTVVFCQDIIQETSFPIAYNWDENEILIHIGYRFLSGIDTVAINQVVVQFIERELLRLLTASNINKVLTANKENALSMYLNNKPIKQSFFYDKRNLYGLLNDVSGISVNYDGAKYEVELSCSTNQKLSFQFKSDSELLSGMDKKERDICLALQLKNHRASQNHRLPPDLGYLQLLQDSLYISKGNSFMIPEINNDIYYVKTDESYTHIFDELLLEESFANALLVPNVNNYTLNITHRMYGGAVKKYTINSLDFDDYFFRDYDRYFGVETINNEVLTGTLILDNRTTQCIHLGYVSVKLEDLRNGGAMDMQLYSNIPQHNIESLFDKKQP